MQATVTISLKELEDLKKKLDTKEREIEALKESNENIFNS